MQITERLQILLAACLPEQVCVANHISFLSFSECMHVNDHFCNLLLLSGILALLYENNYFKVFNTFFR